jgi:hypothetical protein
MRSIPQHVRAEIYRVATVVLPLLTAYGVVKDADAALWVGALGALLVPGLAAVNTPRGRDDG